MNYQNKKLCKVRTVTVFLSLEPEKEQWENEISTASAFLSEISQKLIQSGYEVQSVRIVTNPFGEYLNTSNIRTAKEDLKVLSTLLETLSSEGTRVRFAIGEARTVHEISILPELIQDFGDLCNACVNVGIDELGLLDNDLIEQASEAILKISKITPRGEGNFNFTVNCNCQPLIPYFPAGYHRKELGNQFVIGLETPDLLVNVLKQISPSDKHESHTNMFGQYYEAMHTALQYHISIIAEIVNKFEFPEAMYQFAGFDSSAAPSKSCSSMVEVYEQMNVDYFGASGTVEASSLLTKIFKSVEGVHLVGFSGLMLALTEDRGLAEGSVKGNFDIRSLLTYSAVCGIGLDTVPIPGDTSVNKISALIRDTGTMAYRLNKPLTVRLFPVPGLQAGEMTVFESDDLCNCAVLAVP